MILLRILLAFCFAIPLLLAAQHAATRYQAYRWYGGSLLALLLGLWSDPLQFGVWQLDATLFGAMCN